MDRCKFEHHSLDITFDGNGLSAISLFLISDASVARSFANQFPFISILGFLVFGPIIDIKNLTMLSGNVSKKFIAKLTVTVFLVCFFVMCTCSFIGLREVYRMREAQYPDAWFRPFYVCCLQLLYWR